MHYKYNKDIHLFFSICRIRRKYCMLQIFGMKSQMLFLNDCFSMLFVPLNLLIY